MINPSIEEELGGFTARVATPDARSSLGQRWPQQQATGPTKPAKPTSLVGDCRLQSQPTLAVASNHSIALHCCLLKRKSENKKSKTKQNETNEEKKTEKREFVLVVNPRRASIAVAAAVAAVAAVAAAAPVAAAAGGRSCRACVDHG